MFIETTEIGPVGGKTLVAISQILRVREAGPDSIFVSTAMESFLVQMSYPEFRSILEEFQTIRPFKYMRTINGTD